MDPAATLPAKVREGCTRDLNRADQVGGDLVEDLLVSQFLGGAEQAMAGVVDHDVDLAELSKRLIGPGLGHERRSLRRSAISN
jgi:hypothetical protein